MAVEHLRRDPNWTQPNNGLLYVKDYPAQTYLLEPQTDSTQTFAAVPSNGNNQRTDTENACGPMILIPIQMGVTKEVRHNFICEASWPYYRLYL